MSQRILADGRPVGYMVRDELGWSFLAGDETQAYVDDPANLALTSLTEMIAREPAIEPHLTAAVGTALVRTPTGFAVERGPESAASGEPAPGLHPEYPVATGVTALSPQWSVTLPHPMNRRLEDGSLVLWRPGVTAWLSLWNLRSGESPAACIERLSAQAPPHRFDVRRWRHGELQFVGYRVPEPTGPAAVPPLYGFAAGPTGYLAIAVYFDDEAALTEAGTILASAQSPAAADAGT